MAEDASVGHSLHHEGGGPQRFSLSLVCVGDQQVVKHHPAHHHLAGAELRLHRDTAVQLRPAHIVQVTQRLHNPTPGYV